MRLKNLELMDLILRVSSGNQNVTIAKCLKLLNIFKLQTYSQFNFDLKDLMLD